MYDPTITSGDTRSIWYGTLSAGDLSALQGDGPFTDTQLRVDVAIIGAGISGLSVAYHLCKAGVSVAVFDKGLVGSGETGRTTAHLANALDEHFTTLEQVHGKSGARMAAESHAAAIADIERIVAAEGIACEFIRVPGYLESIHSGRRAERELNDELEAAQRAGLRVSLIDNAEVAWARAPRLRFEDQAQLNPLAYLLGLVRAIRRMGGRVYTRTRVADVDSTSEPLVVTLSDGRTVTARDVVVATNSPMVDRFAMHTKQAAYRSYALALQLSAKWSPALWWDTGDPYHYVRGTGDGLLIVGGEDHKTGQASDPEHSWAELEAWARARFPEPITVRSRWSGQILEPFDGLAFIGRNPGVSEHVFIVCGDSGNGMTHGALAGLLLSELVQGREHPWASLYDPSRKPHNRAVASFVRENINVAQHALQGLLSAEPVGSTIAPGTGEIVRSGMRRLAMYVAEDGSRHACSAVCPHLGCLVQWNSAEKSWDCPCHGSRFDPYGHVLTGPAKRDLEPVDKPKLEDHSMEQRLLRHLSHELWQTEVSASQHSRREAERLGDTPPARALLAAAEHADSVLAELPKLTQGRPLATSGIGMAIGKMFSEVRDTIADKLLTSERSYRGTLLGLRHGIDVVHLLRKAAAKAQDETLTAFLDSWLRRREPIVEEVVAQLGWFAERPELALKPARGVFTKRAA
jgi:glycine/D-amino acid oxidase-like deaminating enzyme/nitrite reductase/ring-hydroxylating ferredoxin subunit